MPTWSILRGNGDNPTFAQALIGNIDRLLVNQDPDTIEVSFSRLGLAEAEPFGDESIVVLRGDVRWFVGHRPETTPAATGRAQSFSVTLYGPWWHLDHTIFMQTLKFVTDPTLNPAVPEGESALSYYPTTPRQTATIYIGEDDAITRVNTRGMILAALNYAIGKGAPLQVGTVDDGVDIARQEYRGMTCGDVVRQCLAWTPGQAAWFDYTTTPPTLHIRERANRDPIAIDLDDAETEQVSIVRRRGEAEAGVRLEYLRVHERANFRFRTLDLDEAGPNPTGIGALIVPIELYGSFMAGTTVVAAEPIPAGLAAQLFAVYSLPAWEGPVKLARQEVGAEAWLAHRLNVLHGSPLWTEMGADIQSSVDSTFSGRTELTLGRPKHLGPQELVNLVRKGRSKAPDLVDRTIRGGAGSGGGAPTTPSIPAASADPTLIFAPHTPAVVLVKRQYTANNSCSGSGTIDASVVDKVTYHATAGAGTTDTLLATDLLVGQILTWHGASVGRGTDIDYGLCGGICFDLEPSTHPPGPVSVEWAVYGDGTPPGRA